MRKLPIILAAATLFTSCASQTLIKSNPEGAKVFIQDAYVGVTPFAYSDTKIVGSTTNIRLEKEGYSPLVTTFSRNEKADVGAIIGGVFVLFPFLWTMKYDKERMYDLQPIAGGSTKASDTTISNNSTLKEKLEELKKLFDDKLITKEEYEKQKEALLNKYAL
ncbi:PEGA domain-containing protein [Sphingobacterium rhinopitheci]|uniref:PEGA domain-containing protein n=1 Tax=Sphingobacterium rhinopitheci TaxID=2781960 RepID=UPI001F5276B8|nr:PEGA domain-containing protein [Sphingobacterium rhinopitheci]MCI0920940.1 PEGA domain-containing protein [Sphingobacterium rhinopitheci]